MLIAFLYNNLLSQFLRKFKIDQMIRKRGNIFTYYTAITEFLESNKNHILQNIYYQKKIAKSY